MPEELGNFTAPDRLRHLVALLTDNGKNNHRFENFSLLNTSKWILAGGFPRDCMRFYGYPSSRPDYVFIVEEDDLKFPHLHVRTPSSGHDTELLERSLQAVLSELQPALAKHGRMLLEADTTVRAAFFKLQREGAPFETVFSVDCYPFYMNEEQKEEILKASSFLEDIQRVLAYENESVIFQKDFEAPKGYEIGVVNALDDAEFIHSMWPHGAAYDDAITRERLEHLPSVCIRDSDGQLASWELTHNFGSMTHLFTVEKHRGKGLGGLAENLLSQILVREGLHVFKNVVIANVNVIRSTLKHPLWSQWKSLDDNGNQEKSEEDIMWSFNAFTYTGK